MRFTMIQRKFYCWFLTLLHFTEDLVMDVETELLQNAFVYLTDKTYPANCSKNEKRCIRKKVQTLVVKEGVVYYKKKSGDEVFLCLVCTLQGPLIYMYISHSYWLSVLWLYCAISASFGDIALYPPR